MSLYTSPLTNSPVRSSGKALRFSELCGFFDRQWDATAAADAHRFTLYGGSRGPGKSYWLRWYPVRFLLTHAANGLRRVRVGLFCEDYPALKDRHITKIESDFPDWLGVLKDSKTEGLAYHLHSRYGGGIIALRNLDDPSKYKSSEYALLAIDELTQNKSANAFHTLRGSLRWPGIDDTKFIAASNPDGPGQVWVRELFVEKTMPPELKGRQDQFAFVRALPGDNPHLPASYLDELASLPDHLRRAWLEGDWYVTMVGLVYSDFGAENIIAQEPDPEQPIELACDEGYIDPRAILFIQRTATEILVFDEIYHSKHLAETCVSEAVAKCEQHGLKRPELAVGSPEAKELQGQFRKADIPYRFTPHKIVQGIDVVRRLIKDANGYRALKVHPRCKNLIRELTEGYRYPEQGSRGSDEVPVDENNHASDAFRYWAWVRART